MGGLLNSATLDVIVGLLFVYLLLAIMCSSINEAIAGLCHLRSGTLTQGLKQLLDGQDQPGGAANNAAATWLVDEFNKHPLISGMKLPNGDLPSYLPSRTFAAALLDLVTPGVQGPITFSDLQTGLGNLPDGDVKKALLALTQNAQDDLEKAQSNIEAWFDDAMDQASGWYKRKAALATFFIALALTLGTDADTIQITRNLWKNPTARAKIVAEANKQTAPESKKDSGNTSSGSVPSTQNTPPAPASGTITGVSSTNAGTSTTASDPATEKSHSSAKLTSDEIDSLGEILPVWKDLPTGDCAERVWGWLKKSLGLILTVAAVSLGAPFWFDILGKIANLRNAGQKPDKSQTADANS